MNPYQATQVEGKRAPSSVPTIKPKAVVAFLLGAALASFALFAFAMIAVAVDFRRQAVSHPTIKKT